MGASLRGACAPPECSYHAHSASACGRNATCASLDAAASERVFHRHGLPVRFVYHGANKEKRKRVAGDGVGAWSYTAEGSAAAAAASLLAYWPSIGKHVALWPPALDVLGVLRDPRETVASVINWKLQLLRRHMPSWRPGSGWIVRHVEGCLQMMRALFRRQQRIEGGERGGILLLRATGERSGQVQQIASFLFPHLSHLAEAAAAHAIAYSAGDQQLAQRLHWTSRLDGRNRSATPAAAPSLCVDDAHVRPALPQDTLDKVVAMMRAEPWVGTQFLAPCQPPRGTEV